MGQSLPKSVTVFFAETGDRREIKNPRKTVILRGLFLNAGF
jgi:hypothetical protein